MTHVRFNDSMKTIFLALLAAGLVCGVGCRSAGGKFLTQMEMNELAGKEFQQADKRVQKLCSELRTHLDADGRAKFDAAQAAWISFRKAEAESCADFYRGGSIVPAVYCQSLTDSTEKRISQLQAELHELAAH